MGNLQGFNIIINKNLLMFLTIIKKINNYVIIIIMVCMMRMRG